MDAQPGTDEPDHPDVADLADAPENHRRGIRTTLVMVDQLLCRVDQWAGGYAARSALIDERNTLSREQCVQLRALTEELRGLIARAAADLHLEPETPDAAQSIWSECLSLRVGVTELGAHHLRRYGEVPPRLADYADALAEVLADGLSRLSDAATGGRLV
ncbi:MAG TPA: hypothetical protein PLD23_18680 [Armatimonadota bacterium]|nr:hypothetical protein [Armatimonadota bacterium]HQK95530.1 hypothetical protein [Armatimonadota bacterium]